MIKITRAKVLKIAMAAFLALIIISFFCATFLIRQPRSQAAQSISARFFPRTVIGLLAITSIICIIQEFRKPDKEEERLIKPLFASIAVMFCCVLLLDILGFLIVGFLFMLLEIRIAGDVRFCKSSILSSLCCAIIFSLLFRYGFNIGIPLLPFGLL